MKFSTTLAAVIVVFAGFAAAAPGPAAPESLFPRDQGSCKPDDPNNELVLGGKVSKRDLGEEAEDGDVEYYDDSANEDEKRESVEARGSDPCCNNAGVKRHLDKFHGHCQPDGKRSFHKSSHNCANKGGKSYLCVKHEGGKFVSHCLTVSTLCIKIEKTQHELTFVMLGW